MAAGCLANSQAVFADGIHSLSDLATDLCLLVGLQFWSKPRDDDHPYGHGRIEQAVTLFIALLLGATGVGLIWNAIRTVPEALSENASAGGWVALAAALASLVVKEILFQWTRLVGKRNRSSALLANAWHHRTDALSSFPAAVSVGLTMLDPALRIADNMGAVVVAFIVLRAAAKIAFPTIGQLIDTAPPKRLREAIARAVASRPRVHDAHAIRTRYIGPDIALDLHVEVDPDLTVREGHDIAECVSRHIREEFNEVIDIVVHVEPDGDSASRQPECPDPERENRAEKR
jgi:cation diffusion facilitator family transporter